MFLKETCCKLINTLDTNLTPLYNNPTYPDLEVKIHPTDSNQYRLLLYDCETKCIQIPI